MNETVTKPTDGTSAYQAGWRAGTRGESHNPYPQGAAEWWHFHQGNNDGLHNNGKR